jgi:hypothetical protein
MTTLQFPSGPAQAAKAAALRDHFLGWQCRIRQHAVRQGGGRPSDGMRPLVSLEDERAELGQVTVLIVKRDPEEETAQFRHMMRKTKDPADRYKSAIKFLSATYYQRPQEFSDEMTALFAPDSQAAERIVTAGGCRLDFAQFSQVYTLPCGTRELATNDPAFQATFWHNGLFNPNLPGDSRVLAFRPDWTAATADPPVG